jgi:hypothetical protein
MSNPNPQNQFLKGQPRPEGSGRKPGQKVGLVMAKLKVAEAANIAAENLGLVRRVETVGADGKTTTELQYDGTGGMVGYLMWLGLYHPATFGAILRGTMPMEVNTRTDQRVKIEYKSFEQAVMELRASGLTDEKINLLLEDLR